RPLHDQVRMRSHHWYELIQDDHHFALAYSNDVLDNLSYSQLYASRDTCLDPAAKPPYQHHEHLAYQYQPYTLGERDTADPIAAKDIPELQRKKDVRLSRQPTS